MLVHQPVLLQEALHALAIKQEGIYVDGTFGRGGHTQGILNALREKGRLYAIDKDSEAVAFAKEKYGLDKRFQIVHGSFANLKEWTKTWGVFGLVDGILLDLGLSSPQIDDAARGFSFLQEGPLDMRMNLKEANNAAQLVKEASMEELAFVFRTFGEERFAGRIAKAIVKARQLAPIVTTLQLAEIVKEANPKWEKHKHPATRVFQAIRIFVNQELKELNEGLQQSLEVLTPGGRLVVISFHSLEDRMVKQFMREKEQGLQLPMEVPIPHHNLKTNFKRIGKAVMPKEDEVKKNVRARSAVLRVGEKVA